MKKKQPSKTKTDVQIIATEEIPRDLADAFGVAVPIDTTEKKIVVLRGRIGYEDVILRIDIDNAFKHEVNSRRRVAVTVSQVKPA